MLMFSYGFDIIDGIIIWATITIILLMIIDIIESIDSFELLCYRFLSKFIEIHRKSSLLDNTLLCKLQPKDYKKMFRFS